MLERPSASPILTAALRFRNVPFKGARYFGKLTKFQSGMVGTSMVTGYLVSLCAVMAAFHVIPLAVSRIGVLHLLVTVNSAVGSVKSYWVPMLEARALLRLSPAV